MKKQHACLLVILAVGLQQVSACLWDRDTLASELARFPGLAEVMTGQFPRHSREFYEWRRKVCEAALAKDPSQVSVYDDLAVAQHKLGDHKAAIATMLLKDKVKPDQYETFSNLGTFYIYTGELDKAVNWIHKALVINPNAHFGREKYQKWLVQWIQQRKLKGTSDDSFSQFVARMQGNAALQNGENKLTELQRKEAITGVLGMMRFADFDNPILSEALGDLLAIGGMDNDSLNLAALAYLHASRKAVEADEQERLKGKHTRVITGQTARLREKPFDQMLDHALAKGNTYATEVRNDELAWISAGVDVSAEFEKKYLKKG